MKNCITIRKLNEKGDTAVLVSVNRGQTLLQSEQTKGNFIYIPESPIGVYTPCDPLPALQEREIEILVFPPVKGG
jgi:hypothetical protein